ncbi:putative acetyltransferase [Senna tora]|uniref:Putative acetyltransferase n=1 Tax=Senna tora TaxID=362788 RepID=A0A834XAM4_9FABA|nr:putative acetyltransferase [Senna tora]
METLIHASTFSSNNITHLTPWDLQIPVLAYIQRGLLFPNPKSPNIINNNNKNNIVEHLKHSLSRALNSFPLLARRLAFQQHLDDHTFSISILCNNVGALFVHAITEDTTVLDILCPTYIPPFVQLFFQLITNDEPTSKLLLEVQVTELVDSYFVACSINHCAVDGTSFWHFINYWAEISRGIDSVTQSPRSLYLNVGFPVKLIHPFVFQVISSKCKTVTTSPLLQSRGSCQKT